MSPSKSIKKIAINTGGGDAPGLNAVIRAVTLSALRRGWEVYGIRDGYNGLLEPQRYPKGDGVIPLERETVSGITHLGGTILGTTNRGNPLSFPQKQEDGSIVEIDRTPLLAEKLNEQFDAVVSLGGDGSMAIANKLNQLGVKVVGVPKTIDNDLVGTHLTFGFDTASSFATECIDRLHSTAQSHERIMVVEVMGRYAGWIALYAGVAGTADAILIPELPYNIDFVVDKIKRRYEKGRRCAMVVVAEGARPKDGGYSIIGKEAGQAERLGGAANKIAKYLQQATGYEARHVVLGHLQRGGSPSALDRMISLRFGAAAVRALDEGVHGIMVALNPPEVRYVPLSLATSRMKMVNLEGDTMKTARELGICFGDVEQQPY